MKRVAVLLVLAVGVVAVVMLLLSMDGDDYGRERRTGGVASSSGADGEGSGEPRDEDATDGDAAGRRGVDDDPNRIPGPAITVRGIVLLDGVPVPSAKVQLIRAQPDDPALQRAWADPRRHTEAPAPLVEGEADENGRFTLTTPRRSRLEVLAYGEKTGIGRAKLVIPKEGDPDEVTVRVGRGYEVTGIVVDEKGEPAGGVKILCSTSEWQSYAFQQRAETDAGGRFGFGNLGRGAHTLVIEKEGYPTLQRSIVVPQAREIRVELVIGGAIAGTLTAAGGSAVAGARILLTTGDVVRRTFGYVETTTDESGAYSIPLAAPGPITSATIEHADWGKRESSRGDFVLPREPVKASESLAWDIELKTGVTVRGVVVAKDSGKPVPDAQLTFMRNVAGARNLQPVRYGKADANGRFVVAHIQEGTYAIAVKAKGHVRAVAQWIQPNEKMVTDFFSDGVNDPDAVRIEAVASGRIEGHLKGEGLDEFSSTWIQIPELNSLSINARADSTGFFVIDRVPAGQLITLKTWQPPTGSEPFTVEAGETKTVDLEADGPPQFTGTVTGSDGQPVVGAYVKAASSSGANQEFRNILSQGGWGTARTDSEGKFSIRLMEWQVQQFASQAWSVAAVSHEYPLQIKTGIRVPKGGDTVDVQLVLEAGGTISGSVEFEGRGAIANVRVNVSPKSTDPKTATSETRVSRYVYTDLAGRFTVSGIGAGDWTVTTSHPEGKADSQVVTAGDSGVRLTLKPTLSLAGIVVDEDGSPLSGVPIAAIIPTGTKEQRRAATTDASGRFRIAQLDAGDYELEVTPKQNQGYYVGTQRNGGFKKTRTRAYPAGTEGIVVEVEPGATISGRVLDPAGRPISGAGMIALPLAPPKRKPGQPYRQSSNQPTTFTNGKGEFTLKGVGDGGYEILAIASGYLISTTQAAVGEEGVVITMKQGAVIEGLLLAPDGKPMGGQWIQLQAQDPEVQKKFSGWWQRGGNSWNSMGGWQATSATTKPDGTFRIAGLFPGNYKVQIYTPRGIPPNTELHTGAGRVTIRLREGLTVSGRVVDESGNALVLEQGVVFISSSSGGQWKSVQADSDGNFELKGLAEGTVKLQVWGGNEYTSASVDVQAGDSGVRITLKKKPVPAPK